MHTTRQYPDKANLRGWNMAPLEMTDCKKGLTGKYKF